MAPGDKEHDYIRDEEHDEPGALENQLIDDGSSNIVKFDADDLISDDHDADDDVDDADELNSDGSISDNSNEDGSEPAETKEMKMQSGVVIEESEEDDTPDIVVLNQGNESGEIHEA